MTLVALVNMAMSVTDTLMAARFGPAGLAAVAVGSDFYSIVFVFSAGCIGGLAPLYAAAAEAQDETSLRRLRAAGWMLAVLLAFVAVPLVWAAPDYLCWLRIPEALLEDGRGYTQAIAATLVPMLCVAVLRNRLMALERPGLIVRVTACAVPANAALNWLLMHGAGGWDGLGITGLGVSSLIVATGTAAALGLVCQRAGDRRGDIRAIAELREALRLGLPIGFTMLAELGVFLGATLFAARFGVEAAAAHALTIRLAGLVYAVSIGLQQAATVRMARKAEAGDRQLPFSAGTRLGLAAGVAHASILAALAFPLANAVFDDPATAAIATGLILLLALSELLVPLGAVAAGLMRGLKDTRMPMVFSLLGNWGVTLPLALLLTAVGLGVTGLWIALAAGTLVACVLTTLRLRRHRVPQPA
ncbi:MATE family efflux transporter [Roseovarius nitratireducens]|uniref:MATE family efflux transporter n=1 Tax=Roseovarius nitratireducens TaxID=2044597 RepID=UPI0019814E2B|nr:MATE family efflux transporter [Roseovarius nitratireducens]